MCNKPNLTAMDTIRQLGALSGHWQPESYGNDVGRLYRFLFTKGMDRESAEAAFVALGKSPQQFRNAHSKLMDRMIGGMLASDFQDCTPAQRAYFKTLKRYVGAEILMNRGAKDSGRDLAAKTLEVAAKHERIDLCLNLSRRLYNHYANIAPDTEKRKVYLQKVRHYAEEQAAEVDAETILNELVAAMRTGGGLSVFKKDIEALSPRGYWRHDYAYYKSKIYFSFHNNDMASLMDTCREAIEGFSKKKILPSAVRFVFYFYQIPALIINGQYGKAETVIGNCVPLHPPGSVNWSVSLYFRSVCGLHSGKYSLALAAYLRSTREGGRSGAKEVSERQGILKAYLFLLSRVGLLRMDGNFKLYKFLNSVGMASSDKKGQNVAVTVVHLLHLLVDIRNARKEGNTVQKRRKEKAYMEKAGSVGGYIARHLTEKRDFRKKVFLSMLFKVEPADYRKKAVLEKTVKLRQSLLKTPISTDMDGLEAEPLPFERCWDIALSLLK